jgi:DNA-binding HxlR family transcriptional regulator
MRQTSFADFHCSLARTLEVVGDWWSPLILRDLYLGLDTFDDLVTDLGASRNIVADRLNTLVAGGVVERVPYQQRPVRHRYVLTEAGKGLVPALIALTAWGDHWVSPERGAPVRYRHDECGQVFSPLVVCDSCNEPIVADAVSALPGPGGRTASGTMLVERVLAH